eukprot:9434849-Alexandrium_andersonii.AAC.1
MCLGRLRNRARGWRARNRPGARVLAEVALVAGGPGRPGARKSQALGRPAARKCLGARRSRACDSEARSNVLGRAEAGLAPGLLAGKCLGAHRGRARDQRTARGVLGRTEAGLVACLLHENAPGLADAVPRPASCVKKPWDARKPSSWPACCARTPWRTPRPG